LGRDRGSRALEDLQERLLHAFAGDVAGDRRVVGFARDLVDLVDVDDSGFCLLDVVVGGLDQLQEDVLDILADVPGLGQGCRVGDRERDVEDPGEGLGEQGLAAPGRAEQEDVRLLKLDVGVPVLRDLDPLVVVVDGDREGPLRRLLADDVLLQDLVDLPRFWQILEFEGSRRRELLIDDLVAEVDALVADVDAGPGDQLLDLALRLPAEAAEELLV
jgi:hypothetical protein